MGIKLAISTHLAPLTGLHPAFSLLQIRIRALGFKYISTKFFDCMSHCFWGQLYHKTFGNFRGPLVMCVKAVFGCSWQVSQFRKFLTSACAPKFLGRHMHRYTPPPTPPLFISLVKVCQAEVLQGRVDQTRWLWSETQDWDPDNRLGPSFGTKLGPRPLFGTKSPHSPRQTGEI